MDFLRRNYVSLDMGEAQDIIREYDSTHDLQLDFTEFSQLVLPASDNYTRNVAENRRFGPYFRASDPLPYDVVSRMVRLFEKELTLQRHRNESKRQLAASPDFIKVRAFDDIARGRQQITVHALTSFLERNAFFPRHTDIEAILRRIDHNADQALSYDEFCELTSITVPSTSPESPQKQTASSPLKQESNEKKVTVEETKVDSQSFQSPDRTSAANEPGSRPVKSFELSENKQTIKKNSASPTKQERQSAEKAAADERARVEAAIESEKKAVADARAKREAEMLAEQQRREEEIRLAREKREKELEEARAKRE